MLDFLIGNDFLSSLIAFGIVLIPAVIIHELGHFLAAKSIGITVLEFGIGFPPRAAKLFTWGETEFTLNWIPLGGFVRPLGEDMVRPLTEEETEREREQIVANRQSAQQKTRQEDNYISEREELAERGVLETMSVNEAKPFPRIFFMAAGALANFLSALLIFVAIGLIGVPEVVGDRIAVLHIDPTSTLAQIGIQNGDFIERVNGELFADSDEFVEMLSGQIGEEVEFTVLRPPLEQGDDDLVFETESLLITEDFVSSLDSTENYVRVSAIAQDAPADGILEPNDLIIGVDHQSLTEISDDVISVLQDISVERAGESIILTVIRNGEELDVTLIPREDPPENEGRIGIGITLGYLSGDRNIVYVDSRAVDGLSQIDYQSQDLPTSISYSFDRVIDIFALIGEFPARLIQGATEPEERRLVSIVGVSQIGGQFLQDSVEDDRPTLILEYIALISIALGVTNLLPIPALDGGRILFVVVEIIRGRPISPERESIVHLAGLIFLLFIGIIFIINDLFNPITNSLP